MQFTVRKQPYYTGTGSQFLLHTCIIRGRIWFLLYISIVPGTKHSAIWVHSCSIFLSPSLFSLPQTRYLTEFGSGLALDAVWLADVSQATSDGQF